MSTRSKLTSLKKIGGREADMAHAFMAANPLPKGDDGLAIFYRQQDGAFAFVKDLRVPSNKGGSFHMEMLNSNFYRSGGSVFILTEKGLMVITDERRRHKKPFPVGLAQHSQGHDLSIASRAEFEQEVIIYTLSEKKVQILPPGIEPARNIPTIGCALAGYDVTFNDLEFVDFFVNEPQKAYECRLKWDISHIGIKTYSVAALEDKWFLGGEPDIPVWVIDPKTGKDVGYFAGQQGFVEDGPNWGLHASVANFCGIPVM